MNIRERLDIALNRIVSFYCWSALAANTIFFVTLAFALQPFYGRPI